MGGCETNSGRQPRSFYEHAPVLAGVKVVRPTALAVLRALHLNPIYAPARVGYQELTTPWPRPFSWVCGGSLCVVMRIGVAVARFRLWTIRPRLE